MAKKLISSRIPLDVVKGVSHYTGVDDLYNLNFDPINIGAYGFIYWVKLPSWFNDDPDLAYFKPFTEKNFRAFSGVDDIELNTMQHLSGFAGNEYDIAGDINKGNSQFTIGHKEYQGSIMRKLYQKWISYIKDYRTGISTYSAEFDVEYGQRNHTGILLYIQTKPSVTATQHDIVEYAALYTNVFPTNIPLSIYNYEQGSQESPTIDINFRGNAEIGPDVDEYAAKILREEIINSSNNPDGGIPFLDSLGSNPHARSILNSGILKDLYNNKDE